MKALLIKELRENIKWLTVGLILFSFVAYCWLPKTSFESPYTFVSTIENQLSAMVGCLGGLFAFSLGVLQSAFDLRSGSRAYLQHRGVKSTQIAIAKLITGFAIYSASILIPMSLLAIYLGWFGIHTIPVRPFQVAPAIGAGFFGFIMHPTAIFCLSRCASWWGTKTLPIVAAVAVVFGIFVLLSSQDSSIFVWLWLLPVYVLLLAITCWAAVDAWEKLSLNPPVSQSLPNGWRVNSILILGSIVCAIIAIQFLTPIGSLFHPTEPNEYVLKFDVETGEPWAVSIKPEDLLKSNLAENDGSIFGSKVELGIEPKEFSLLPKKLRPTAMKSFQNQYFPSQMFLSTRFDQYIYSDLPIWTSVMDHRGYLLRYSVIDRRRPSLDSIIDRDGVHPPNLLPDNRFANLREIENYPSGFLAFIDDRGVYALQGYRSNAPEMRLHRLVEGNVHAAALTSIPSSDIQRLVVVVDGELREYRLLDENGSEDWTIVGETVRVNIDGEKVSNRQGEQEAIRAELFKSVAIPSAIRERIVHTYLRTELGYLVSGDSITRKLFLLGFDGTTQEVPFSPKYFTGSYTWYHPIESLTPPALNLSVGIIRYILSANRGESAEILQWITDQKSNLVLWVLLSGIFVVASMWFVNRMLRKRGITGQLRWGWLIACIPLGIATPLIIASIYPVRIREKCSSCGKLRSVDLDRCEACGAEWPLSEQEGIEVFDTHGALEPEASLRV